MKKLNWKTRLSKLTFNILLSATPVMIRNYYQAQIDLCNRQIGHLQKDNRMLNDRIQRFRMECDRLNRELCKKYLCIPGMEIKLVEDGRIRDTLSICLSCIYKIDQDQLLLAQVMIEDRFKREFGINCSFRFERAFIDQQHPVVA